MEEIRVADENESTQFIVIKIGNEQYGINIAYIDNIVRMTHITRVPKAAPYIKGVINLRGIVIPVMSLRIKMGLPQDEYTKATRIIILKLEQHGTVGVVVDEVKEVVALDNSQIEKVATDAQADHVNYVQNVGKCGDELISILDLNAVAAE